MKLSYELSLMSLYGLNRCENLHYTNSYVLDEFGIDYTDAFWRNSVVVLVHFLVYRLVFWIILVNKVNKQSYISRPEMFIDPDMEQMDQDMKNK